MESNNRILTKLYKGKNQRDFKSPHESIQKSRTDVYQGKLMKKAGSRRRCLSPEGRKKLETSTGTVKSAPALIDCNQSLVSVKSAPTAEIAFRASPSESNNHTHRSKSMGHNPPHIIRDNYTDRRSKSIGHNFGPIAEEKYHPVPSLERYRSTREVYGESTQDDSNINQRPPIRSLKNVRKYNSERLISSTTPNVMIDDDVLRSHSTRDFTSSSRRMMTSEKSVGVKTCQSMDSQALLFRRKSNEVKTNVKIPQGIVTIVVTDVEGSTKLWEQDASAMKEALDLHDKVVRKCYTNHNGYEITTEGDSFYLAFHHPLDALSFALQVQVELYNADWPSRILALKGAKLDKVYTMNGLRIRIGMHHGETVSYEHDITKRTFYKGEAMSVAKAIELVSHGGQIITTVETWKAVSGMAERYLGSPQVIDCGEHELDDDFENGLPIIQKLVQLVPKRFAYDYFAWRGAKDVASRDIKEGRRFPPLKTKRQLNTAFRDAPYKQNEVVIVFVYTVTTMDDLADEAKANNLAMFSKYLRYQLLKCSPQGYECQETNGQWMLAFHTIESAITFGVRIVNKLKNAPLNVKIGIQKGPFTSQGPHAVTGRADYFGTVVNRAARVASSGEAGQVLLGVAEDQLKYFDPPTSDSFRMSFLRSEKFKGMTLSTNIYLCS